MAQSRGKGNYVINTFNGMAYGFFASLIIGTILKQLGTLVHVEQLVTWGDSSRLFNGTGHWNWYGLCN